MKSLVHSSFYWSLTVLVIKLSFGNTATVNRLTSKVKTASPVTGQAIVSVVNQALRGLSEKPKPKLLTLKLRRSEESLPSGEAKGYSY